MRRGENTIREVTGIRKLVKRQVTKGDKKANRREITQ